jgi:hypothetical protein
MEKETVLAKIRVTMGFSKAVLDWLEKIQNTNIWFVREGGTPFFSEFRGSWERILVSSSETIIHDYFLKLGLPKEKLPHVKVYESYSGSWIMEAALIMFASIGTAYSILKGISELPKIADGLTELKDRLKKEFSRKASEKVYEHLKSEVNQYKIPPPPSKQIKQIIYTDFVLDARPLSSLTPSIMKSHKVHLNVAISRDAFTLENLGQDMMRDIRIGIFKSPSQRNQWSFTDSYMSTIDVLSSQQTIIKDIADFRNSKGEALDLSDSSPLHVDCWVQDSHGIYLFMFYLES